MWTKMSIRSRLLKKKCRKKKEVIANPIPKEWFALRPMKPGELKRRYWTYYSEVEINMSQGKVANWANGGETPFLCLVTSAITGITIKIKPAGKTGCIIASDS